MTQTQRKIHFSPVNYAIARLTAETGINNQKLSVAAGFNSTFLWYVMNGKRGLTTETLVQVAQHFSTVLARPLPELILEILGINPDGTLTDGQGNALDAVPAHQTPGTVPLLPVVADEAPVAVAKAKKPKAAKPDDYGDIERMQAVRAKAQAKKTKKAQAQPTGEVLEAKPLPVALTRGKLPNVYVENDMTTAKLLADAEKQGLTVYTWAGTNGKATTFAVAAAGPRALARLTGMGMSKIYGATVTKNPEDALILTACLAAPTVLLCRPLASAGAFTVAE